MLLRELVCVCLILCFNKHLPALSYSLQVVKSGSSETRVEKRIVITADSDVDQDKVRTPTTVSTQREDFRLVADNQSLV